MDIPVGYILPTSKNVPFFQNMFTDDLSFGITSSSGMPANRVCLEHTTPTTPDIPSGPTDPSDPNTPEDPNNPTEPTETGEG
jgi:hypothetical protein